MPTRYDADKHHRRSIRLRMWDYRDAGAYFVTICTYGGQPLFGEVVDGTMRLNEYGRIVEEEWRRTAEMRPGVTLDAFVIMPNHLHGIIWIRDDADDVRATCRSPVQKERGRSPVQENGGRSPVRAAPWPDERPRGPQSGSLGAIIAGFKSACTRRINEMRGTPGAPVWQRNYYERIIRNDREWNAIREYIQNNPITWEQDAENPTIPVGTRRPGP